MKKLTRIVGLQKSEFDSYVNDKAVNQKHQILVRPSRLIPILKPGDEMALTSILLSSIKLIKEFRNNIFKEIKFPKGGKCFYYTEVSFPDSEFKESRIDGLIINVSGGIIKDAVFFEMKSGINKLEKLQIERYIKVAKQFKVDKLVTVSNEFVSDSKESPIEKLKTPKFNLFHFSWTHIQTLAQILLFDNDENIEDEDQVNIMQEVISYFENPKSGLSGYSSMHKDWKDVCEKIHKDQKINKNDSEIRNAVRSWHQEEKDLALLLSRNLGVAIKSSIRKGTSSIDDDVKKLINTQKLNGFLIIKDALSKIEIDLDFNKKTVSLSADLIPPMDKKNTGKVSYLLKQLDKCKRHEGVLYNNIESEIFITPYFKSLRTKDNYSLFEMMNSDFKRHNDIQKFKVLIIKNFKGNFASQKKFVSELENTTLMFYEAIIQHLSNWKKPPPKVDNFNI
jgi:hypothetical protein|tara:strand:+ start:36 stop:1385 length:1350 start_codon:yes stop_codon:yes gene_type:complete